MTGVQTCALPILRDELLPPADSLRLSLRVFALFTVVYLCTWAGHYTSGDGSIKIAWSKALLHGHIFDAGPALGEVYSKYGIGHTLRVMPPQSGVVTQAFPIYVSAGQINAVMPFISNCGLIVPANSSRSVPSNQPWIAFHARLERHKTSLVSSAKASGGI